MNCQVSEEAAVAKIKDRCGGEAREEPRITYGWQAGRTPRLFHAAPFEEELLKLGPQTERLPDESILALLIVS